MTTLPPSRLRPIFLSVLAAAALTLLGGCSDPAPKTPPAYKCGDGRLGVAEACDGAKLDGRTCEDFGYGSGELGCMDNCRGFRVADCEGVDASKLADLDCTDCAADEICRQGECVAMCRPDAALEAGTRHQLDGNLEVVTVEGTVTLDGEDLPAPQNSGRRPYVAFHNPWTGQTHQTQVSAGDGSYTLELPAQTYRVYLKSNGHDSLPTMAREVEESLEITGDRHLDVDLPKPATVETTVELSGGGPEHLEIILRRGGDAEQRAPTGVGADYDRRRTKVENGEATATFEAYPGAYRVEVRGIDHAPEMKSIEVPDDSEVGFAIQTHRLRIGLEANGEAVSADRIFEPTLETRPFPENRPDYWSAAEATLETTDSGALEGRVTPGRYRWTAQFEYEGRFFQAEKEFTVDADREVTVTAPAETAPVRGEVHGLPDDDTRYTLEFFDSDPQLNVARIPLDDSASFETRLTHGSHDVYLNPPPDSGPYHDPDRDPGRRQLIRAGLEIDGAREISLGPGQASTSSSGTTFGSSAEVVGRVLLDGELIGSGHPTEGAGLVFRRLAGNTSPVTTDIRTSGGLNYRAKLPPGTYRVELRSPLETDDALVADPPTPRGVAVVEPRLEVSGDMRRDFAARSMEARFGLTANGGRANLNEVFGVQQGDVDGEVDFKTRRGRDPGEWTTLGSQDIEPDLASHPKPALPLLSGIHRAEYFFHARTHSQQMLRRTVFVEFSDLLLAGRTSEESAGTTDIPVVTLHGKLTLDGKEWPGGKTPGRVRAKTRFGHFDADIAPDGEWEMTVAGRNPTVTFRLRRVAGEIFRKIGPKAVVLRRGCAKDAAR